MPPRQLDLFSAAGRHPEGAANTPAERPRLAAAALDDDALIAAIPRAGLGDCRALAAEAAGRRLARAVPALEELCRRLTGFGLDGAVPEQTAALEALAAIGGAAAATAVAHILIGRIVQGPGLQTALAAAGRLGVGLPEGTLLPLLRHASPPVRAAACRCARASPAVVASLAEMLADTDFGVAAEAACALGRIGRPDARPLLMRLLREAPTPTAIDAIIAIADEECLVLLGRIARTRPDLADPALTALDAIGSPRAATIAAASRRPPPS